MLHSARTDLERSLPKGDPGISMLRRFCIITMGCQMNVYDSEFLARSLTAAGLLPVGTPEEADVVLVNTCTVRAKPEQKAYSVVGRLGRLKDRHPRLILGLVGCLAQQEGAALLDRFPQLDLVLGPRDLSAVTEALAAVATRGERVVATHLHTGPVERSSHWEHMQERVSGYVSIMEGCNNYCSYCIVPYVRGPEVSRDPDHILGEVRALIDKGAKEITLLGQNVNAYRWEGKGRLNFSGLLRLADALEGLVRLRFTTSHPKNLSPELVACFGELHRLCPHIHLPFQAGSNRVLRRMGRGYTREHYLELVSRLREQIPHIAISSDVMVGFPGESERDFDETMDLVRQVQFDSLFSFKYSDRKGTVAESMTPKVPEEEKTVRLATLQETQKKITLQKNKALVGSVAEVLVEGPGKRKGQISGRTPTNKIVNIYSKLELLNNIVNVKIEDGLLNSLRGEIQPTPENPSTCGGAALCRVKA